MIVVCARESPRSAIISARSRKLSLYRRYQRTQSTMISWSKCRPLKSPSIFVCARQLCRSTICQRLCCVQAVRTRALGYEAREPLYAASWAVPLAHQTWRNVAQRQRRGNPLLTLCLRYASCKIVIAREASISPLRILVLVVESSWQRMIERRDIAVGLLQLGKYLPNALELGQRVLPVKRQQLLDLCANQPATPQGIVENPFRERPLLIVHLSKCPHRHGGQVHNGTHWHPRALQHQGWRRIIHQGVDLVDAAMPQAAIVGRNRRTIAASTR